MSSVTTNKDLESLIAELEGAPYLARDTEFMRDQTYWPKLCLLQVAAPGIEAIIDPLAEDMDLAPFYKLLKSPKIVKVLHASRQDIEIFYTQGGIIPEPLFDTQIAAMVAGFGDSASYETLARRLAHVEIDKSARFTDWSRRPLSKRQLEYALADVRIRTTVVMIKVLKHSHLHWAPMGPTWLCRTKVIKRQSRETHLQKYLTNRCLAALRYGH